MKYELKNILALIGLILFTVHALFAHEQENIQTVRGRILDSDTRQPLIGATIMVIGSDPILGAVTDMDGKFRIEEVPVGRISLRINYIGYDEQLIPNVLLGVGKELVMDIGLVESVIKMDEVVVSAAGAGSDPVNEMAMVSGRSFSVEETKRFPISVGDPMRLAASFAGVMGTDDITNEIIVRGNTPRGILWRMEGIEIPSPNHYSSEGTSSGGISMLSTQVLSRSDFYTGAFAPQYGNALSGVFDLHLRKGNNEKHEQTIQAGFLGIDVASEGPLLNRGGSYLVNYRYSTLSVLTGLGLLDTGGEQNIFQDISFNISMPTERLGTFSVFGLGGLSAETFEQNEVDYDIDENYEYNMGMVGLKNQLPLKNNAYVESSVSWAGTEVIEEYDETNAPGEDGSFTKNFIRAQALVNKKFNAQHTVEAGAVFSRIDFNFINREDFYNRETESFDRLTTLSDKDHTYTQQGYASWKFRITDKFTLVNGAHILHYNMNDETTIEPRSSLKWAFAPGQSLSFGYGMHSRMESLEYYLANHIDALGVSRDLNGDLKVTKSNHYVLGYEKVLGTNIHFKVETYYQYLYALPVLRTSEFEYDWYPWYSTINESDGFVSRALSNDGTGRNYGIEITVDKKFSNQYYFLANTSIFSSKYTSNDGIERNTRFAGDYTYNILGGKEWKVGKSHKDNIFGVSVKLSGSGNQRYIDRRRLDTPSGRFLLVDESKVYTQNLPTYFRADLQLSYRKNKKNHTSEWRLDIQSVTNQLNPGGVDFQFDPNGNIVKNYEGDLGLIPILSYRVEF